MGTSALQLGKSGLLSHQKNLDVIGANIANISTNGFHNSRAEFSSLLSRNLSGGTGSTANRGGTNPLQIGLGVQMSAISKSFLQGTVSQTGERTDLAIDGKGFLPVSALNADGSVPDNNEWFFSRDGSLSLGMIANQDDSFKQVLLQKATGLPVLGIPGDPATNKVPDANADGIYDPALLRPIEIPTESIFPAQATSNVVLTGNLNSQGDVATQPAKQQSAFYLANGLAVNATTDLANVYDANGIALFSNLAGDATIEVGVEIGGKDQTADFTYGADGTTVADLGSFFERSFLNTAAAPPAGVEAASVQFLNDQLVVTGNLGASNNLSNLSLKQADTSSSAFTEIQKANGESTRFVADAYDSLGTLHSFDITMVKEATQTNNGQTWRWYANSTANSTGELPIGTGTVLFDSAGSYISDSGDALQINLNNGATDPLIFNLAFGSMSNLAAPEGSSANVVGNNGYAKGELREWVVAGDGTVVGNYTNGQNREFGRIPILTLTNQAGLSAEGDNLYKQSNNTGNLVVRTAGSSIAGQIRQFSLEDSNVDLAMEMTKMIQAQRAFSSSSKVITTDQEIIDTALNLIR